MEEGECVMQTRFIKPYYRIVPLDDVEYSLLASCRQAQKTRSRTCVVIGIGDIKRKMIPMADGCKCSAFIITASMVWGRNGETLKSAILNTATIGHHDDDEEEIALQFASDLVEFFDRYDSELSEIMDQYFLKK